MSVKLGEKHICSSCGAKFYDLGKRPVTCPKCQTALEEEPEPPSRRRKSKPAVKEPAVKEAPKAEPEVSGDDDEAIDVKDEDFEELEDLDDVDDDDDLDV